MYGFFLVALLLSAPTAGLFVCCDTAKRGTLDRCLYILLCRVNGPLLNPQFMGTRNNAARSLLVILLLIGRFESPHALFQSTPLSPTITRYEQGLEPREIVLLNCVT